MLVCALVCVCVGAASYTESLTVRRNVSKDHRPPTEGGTFSRCLAATSELFPPLSLAVAVVIVGTAAAVAGLHPLSSDAAPARCDVDNQLCTANLPTEITTTRVSFRVVLADRFQLPVFFLTISHSSTANVDENCRHADVVWRWLLTRSLETDTSVNLRRFGPGNSDKKELCLMFSFICDGGRSDRLPAATLIFPAVTPSFRTVSQASSLGRLLPVV